MEFVAIQLAILLQFVGPIAGYVWALRAGRSRGHIVAAAAMGGMPAGFLLAVPFITADAALVGLPQVFFSTVIGAGIGLAGLLARAFGAWLGRRP